MNSIERGLIHSRCSTGKLNKLNLKIVSYKLTVVIRTAERSIIATEEKCRQFNWCFRYNMVIIIQDATFYLKCLWDRILSFSARKAVLTFTIARCFFANSMEESAAFSVWNKPTGVRKYPPFCTRPKHICDVTGCVCTKSLQDSCCF